MNLKVRVSDKDCDNGGGEAVEIPLVCAVSDLSAAEYDMILPADVVYKLKATPCTVSASCADVSVVSGEGSEIPMVGTEEGTLEEVDELVASVEFCETGCNVSEGCDVKVEGDSVVTEEVNKVFGTQVQVKGCSVVNMCDVGSQNVTPTPACVSCTVFSVRGVETKVGCRRQEQRRDTLSRVEETENALFRPDQRRKSCPSPERSREQFGDFPGRRGEEVHRIQETVDLEPRRMRSRGSQDVTADKSEVGRTIRGPRGSGRVRPSVSSTASPVVSVVLVVLWAIIRVAGRGTSPRAGAGAVRDITNCNENWTRIMYLYNLLCSECISSCSIVPGQLTIFAIVFDCIVYVSTLSSV